MRAEPPRILCAWSLHHLLPNHDNPMDMIWHNHMDRRFDIWEMGRNFTPALVDDSAGGVQFNDQTRHRSK